MLKHVNFHGWKQHGTLVLASHVRYDELLTTGWNEALADEHHVQPTPSSSSSTTENGKATRLCIQGHKGDPDRKIGLVGLLSSSSSVDMSSYAQSLSQAFEGHEALHIPNNNNDGTSEAGSSNPVKKAARALASLNAFNPEIIERILDSARQLEVSPEEVLCLTGAPRELGIQSALENGMSVLAVGHRRCEMWGLKYLERKAREVFPDLEIQLHEEEEEPRPAPQQQGRRNGQHGREIGKKQPRGQQQ